MGILFGRGKMRAEREAARTLSDNLDRLLAGEPTTAGQQTLQVASRLRQISALLPPVPCSLQGRVKTVIQSVQVYQPTAWQRVRPALWGVLAAAVMLLLLWMVSPGGQTAWAQMLIRLKLGQTWVEVTPTADEAATRAVRRPLSDLLAVELTMGRAPSLPKTLPEGYSLQQITAVSYPDLPAWISQPFYVELCYGPASDLTALCLREYRLLFREYGGLSAFQPLGETEIEQVDVAGVQGALLTVPGEQVQYSVVWERDGLLQELQSSQLSKEELLEIARTVR